MLIAVFSLAVGCKTKEPALRTTTLAKNPYSNSDLLEHDTQGIVTLRGISDEVTDRQEGVSSAHKKAIDVTPESKSHRQIQGFSNFALAQNYSLHRDFEASEKHLIDALTIFKEVGDITNQGTVYLLLHNIFMQKGVYEDAENMLSKAMRIVKQQKSDFLTFSAYGM